MLLQIPIITEEKQRSLSEMPDPDSELIGEDSNKVKWKLKAHQYVSFSVLAAGAASSILHYFGKGVDCYISLASALGGLIWFVLASIKIRLYDK